MKLFFAAVLFLILSVASVNGFQVDKKLSTKNESTLEIARALLPLIKKNEVSLSYLLEELAILDYQKQALSDAVKIARTDWLEMFTEIQNRDEAEPPKEDVNEVSSRIFEKCDASFRDTLLPKQYLKLVGFLNQRKDGMNNEIEPAFLPFLKLVENEQPRGLRNIPDLGVRASAFNEERVSIKTDSLNSVLSQLDYFDVRELEKMLPLLDQVTGSLGGGLSGTPIEVKKWSKQEFDVFEEEAISYITLKMLSSQEIQRKVELTSEQVKEMTQFYLDACSAIEQSDWADPNYAKLVLMTPAGKNEELKKLMKEKMHNRLTFEIDVAKRLTDEFLVPVQKQKLKKIAKFQRSALESKYGDFFGALIGWSKTTIADLPSDFEKHVEAARKKYYEQLSKLRSSTWKSGLEVLTEAEKAKFTERYGELMYDYKQEAVEEWDAIRS